MTVLVLSACLSGLFALYHAAQWARPLPVASADRAPEDQPRRFGDSVSFLVPAWNAAGVIPAFVQTFERLGLPEKQLILCAGGSDASLAVARRYASERVLVLEQPPGSGKQKALRLSLSHATGAVVFLTDIDCRLTDAGVLTLLSALSEDRPVVTGGMRPFEEDGNRPLVTLQWAIHRSSSPGGLSRTTGLLGANTALYRSVLAATGGFAVDAGSGTDYTLAKELLAHSVPIWYVPDCEMATEFPGTLRAYVRKQARWLRNVLVIGPRYRAWADVRAVGITVVLPYLYLILAILGCWLPVTGLGPWGAAAVGMLVLAVLHATLNRLRYVRRWREKVPWHVALLSVLADLAAAGRAGYQWVFRKYVW